MDTEQPTNYAPSLKEKISGFFSQIFSSKNTRVGFFIVAALAVPFFVFVAMQQQDLRQQASENGSVTFLDTTTSQPVTETTTPDVKLQIALPDNWEVAPATSGLNIIRKAHAQTSSVTVPPSPCSTTTNNLIQNPCFETDFASWGKVTSGVGEWAIDSAAKITHVSGPWGTQIGQVFTTTATAGTVYNYNFSVYNPQPGANVVVAIQQAQEPWENIATNTIGITSGGWGTFSRSVTIPPGKGSRFQIYLRTHTPNTPAWFDNIQVVAADTTTPTSIPPTATPPVTTITDTPTPTVPPSTTGEPTVQPTTQPTPATRTLQKIIVKNTDIGTGGQAEKVIENQQDIIAAINTGINWKLNPLATTETTAQRSINVQFVDTQNNQVAVTQQITLTAVVATPSITQTPGTSITPTGPIASPTATVSPMPSGSPSATPVISPTGVIPTMTLAPTATPNPNAILFNVKFALPGIGTASNSTPIYPQRDVTLSVFNNNTSIATSSGKVAYNQTTGLFEGTIDMGTVPAGSYYVKATMQKYLTKTITNLITITPGTTAYTIPGTATLVPGDTNRDNKVDLVDYSVYRDCFNAIGSDCLSLVDFNDDGRIDTILNLSDYRLVIQSLGIRNGD